jgi:DNA-binding transcriptional LysR family regulator
VGVLWDRGHDLRVRIEGQLMFNTAALMMNAALQGFGLAYLTEPEFAVHRHGNHNTLIQHIFLPQKMAS